MAKNQLRQPLTPLVERVKEHVKAVVMLAFMVDDTDQPIADEVFGREFVWMDTAEGVAEYRKAFAKWANLDVKKHGDMIHVAIEVTDTATTPLSIGWVDFFGNITDDWKTKCEAAVKADPDAWVLAQPEAEKQAAPAKRVRKPKAEADAPVVKPARRARKAPEAAAVLKEEEAEVTPAKRARRKPVAKVEEAVEAPAPKARAARKAAAPKTEPKAEAVVAKAPARRARKAAAATV